MRRQNERILILNAKEGRKLSSIFDDLELRDVEIEPAGSILLLILTVAP